MRVNWRFIFRVSFVLFVFTVLSVFFGNNLVTQKAQEQPGKNTLVKFQNPDETTRIIRGAKTSFAVVRTNNEAERGAARNLGAIVEDYGSFVIVANDEAQKIADSNLETQKLETTVNLPYGRFEPEINQAEQSLGFDLQKAETADKNYYIVQFGGIAKDEWLESIREAGAEIVQYVPHQAFIVYGDGEAIGKISNHSKVRWMGKYAAEQKMSPQLEEFSARQENDTAMYDIAVFAKTDLAEISNRFADTVTGKIKHQIKLPSNFFNILRVEMPVSELSKVSAMPGVFRIDPYTQPVIEDERSAQIVAGNYLSTTSISGPGYNPLSQFGVDGTNVTVAVVDDGISIPGNGGFYITSSNAIDGPLHGASSGASGGHGHLNASIIAGSAPFGALDSLGYNYGLGIAPGASVINIPFQKSGYTGNDAMAMDDAVSTTGPNTVPAIIANNSWGNGANGNAYDAYASMYDGFVHDASAASSFDPLTLIFSAGNCGNAPSGLSCAGQTGFTRPKVAKNIITVGNSENIRTEILSSANNIDDLASSSSRGPAADGRIKPDITAPGTVITGARAGNGGGLDGGAIDNHHYYSSGTSHSAAQISGAAALFAQYWKRIRAGLNPSPAIIKAAIINSAQEMNGVNAGTTIPNGNEGWGRINMKHMLNTGVPMKQIDQENTFSGAGDSIKIEGTVSDSTKPVRVTLVWTDPPGISDPALVNNLDLSVTIGNFTYKGNVFSGGRSTTGGSADTINNVENVFLPAGIPAGTPYVVQVSAASINGDGKIGNADSTDQSFALIASNYSLCTYALSSISQTVPISGGDFSVSVTTESFCSWIANNNPSWVTVSPDSPISGNGTVNLTVQPNTNGAQRTGVVSVAGKAFTIQQQGSSCSYALGSAGTNIPNAGTSGSSFAVSTQAGCNWTASSNASWITLTSGAGTGNGSVVFSVQANTGAARSGTITAAGLTYTVNQAAAPSCSYSLSPTGVNIGQAGGTGTVSVTGGASCAWTAVSNVSWITITSGNSGTGNGTVNFSVAPNNGASASGTITIAGQTFTVNQAAACSYNLSSNVANASTGGGTGSFTVNSNAGCAWTAQSNASWITITAGSSGSGTAIVSYSTASNTGNARTGTITVGGQTFTITQDGVNCTYSLSSSSLSVASSGGSGNVNITTPVGCEWSAQSNASWTTITAGASGTASGTVGFTVSSNPGAARSGTITIGGQLFTINQNGIAALRHSPFDFDGDNKTDISIYRPSAGEWWYLKSSHVGNSAFQFGSGTDKLVPADYTGDGKTDIAFFRPATGEWYVLRSEDSSFYAFPFGANGDVPVPADYDGDGRADPAVFRSSTADWFISLSTGGTIIRQFGASEDVPVVSDYDGDGRADLAIYRPSKGEWWMQRSGGTATIAVQFGSGTDKLVQGDYTGDGKTDVAFWRPSTGEWFVLRSEDFSYYSFPFGAVGDIPSPGDYDGDGKMDAAVFRPSNNTWYVQKSSSGTLIQAFGSSGDKPVPSAFIP
ncbi:MAG: hypothetical protein JWN60_2890 [Acidobacteria bacterium]|nr:hypothetical protein [Acidobacteriota bacterium]